MPILLCVIVCGLLGAAGGRSVLDLTHTFDKDAPKWPLEGLGVVNLTYFGMETLFAQSDAQGTWIDIKKLEFYEHQGTHMDAPAHFGKGRQTMHEIPPSRLLGPGVVIDVTDKARVDPNYAVTVQDILAYEEEHGRIPSNAIVMMNSGWGAKYLDPRLVFGSDMLNDSSTFSFPGYHVDACRLLMQDRQVSVIGVDTPSIDPGNSATFACHVLLQNNNMPLLEYVASLERVPPSGSTVFLGAMKHRGGSGGPVRIFAVLDDDEGTSGSPKLSRGHALVLLIVTVVMAIM